MTKAMGLTLRVVLFLASLPIVVLAQQLNVGGITGRVTDPSDAVIAGASVVARNQSTGVEQATDTTGTGHYLLRVLPIGEYTVTVKAPSFKTFQNSDIRVVSAEIVTVNVRLQIGEIGEVVTVTAEAPLLDFTQSVVGTTRTEEEIAKLPLAMVGRGGRAAVGVARTMSGVNFDPLESGGIDFFVVARSNIQGSVAGSWGYMIDGVAGGQGSAQTAEDFSPPSPEAVQEFRLVSNVDASSSAGFFGGVTMQMTIKSGTNDFHGSLFEYMRNDALNARNFFNTLPRGPNPEKQNNFGFAVGGPVVIPGVYNGRNKTFFFTNFDWYRFRGVQTQFGQRFTVPTPLMRGGDLSELLGEQIGTDVLGRTILRGQMYDPLTTRSDGQGGFLRDPFPGNLIPAQRQSPISLSFLGGYAQPTGPGTVNNWDGPGGSLNLDRDQWYSKIDHVINANHRFTFAYEANIGAFSPLGNSGHTIAFSGQGYLDPDISNGFADERDQYRYRFTHLWTISPRLLFNLRAGLTRAPGRKTGIQGNVVTGGRAAGLMKPLSDAVPTVGGLGQISGFGPIFGGFDLISQSTSTHLDLDWAKGSHNLKFGVDFINTPQAWSSANGTQGVISFSSQVSGLPGEPSTGQGFGSFLLGEVHSASITHPSDNRTWHGGWGFYFHDQYRVTPKLTLNFGLRWNLFIPTSETQDKISSFDPTLPNPGAGGRLGALSIYGEGPGRNGLHAVSDYYHGALAPSLGFAYAVTPKTVVRGSYGLSYFPMWHKWLNGTLPQVGFTVSRIARTLDNGVTPAFNWNDGVPVTFPQFPNVDPSLANNGNLAFIDRGDKRPARSQHISFEIGRELPRGIFVRATYIANLTHGLPVDGLRDLNALDLSNLQLGNLLNKNINSPEAQAAGIPLPYPGFNRNVAQALRPFPQYFGIPALGAQVGSSTYHSLQFNFQKRTGDLTFLANYTISKQLTDSFYPGFTTSGSSFCQHPQASHLCKALSLYDRAKVMNLSWIYELPFGPGKRFLGGAKGGLQHLAGGWRLSALQNYMSGFPLRVGFSGLGIPGGFGSIWPNRVPGVPIKMRSCGDIDPGDPVRKYYLNFEAFEAPADRFSLGNVNYLPTVRTCGFLDEAVGLAKTFSITEQVRVEVGSMATNLLNRHTFGARRGNEGINGNANSRTPSAGRPRGGFGTFHADSPGRTIQVFARFEF